jgi:hypothetical protein
MTSDFSSSIQAAFLDTCAKTDPNGQVLLTGPNGQTAQVIATAFAQSKTLKEARLDAKLPVHVTILGSDLVRLAIVDRAQVKIYGQTLTVVVIDSNQIEPLVNLTLTEFA